jgi:hypothetical protein
VLVELELGTCNDINQQITRLGFTVVVLLQFICLFFYRKLRLKLLHSDIKFPDVKFYVFLGMKPKC